MGADVFGNPGDSPGDGRARLIVAGCGNSFAGDDSVGLEIIRRLRVRGASGCQLPYLTSPEGASSGGRFSSGSYRCELLELPDGGLGLVDWFDRAEAILFVDAVRSGAPAGTIHLLPLASHDVVPCAVGAVSGHGWGLNEALELAKALNRPTPRLMLLGIELRDVTPGLARTPAVEHAMGIAIEVFPHILAALFRK